jgi:hypothetical protein
MEEGQRLSHIFLDCNGDLAIIQKRKKELDRTRKLMVNQALHREPLYPQP